MAIIDTGSVITPEEYNRLMSEQGSPPRAYEVRLETLIDHEKATFSIEAEDVSLAYRIQVWLQKQAEVHGWPGTVSRAAVFHPTGFGGSR